MVYSVLGFIGGLLCCVGDVLFDLKGKGNKKLGTSGNIDSNWLQMSYWRFSVSVLFAFIGDILMGFGIFSLANQIINYNYILAIIMIICGYIGVIGGFFVHSCLCIQPVIYKKIMEKGDFELADQTLEAFYKVVIIPFFVAYIIMMIPALCTIIAIIKGYLNVPLWFILLNPIVFLVIGMTLKKIKYEWFYDLPGIIMPSLGFAMMSFIGIVNLL